MPYVTVGRENSGDIDLYYEDHGAGQPVVLIHGYPLNGHPGRSRNGPAASRVPRHHLRPPRLRPVQPAHRRLRLRHLRRRPQGADRHLELRDVVLAGFSMGTGEVTRYLGTYGSRGSSKAALIGAIPPFLLKTDDNPEGVEQSVFDGIKAAVIAGPPAYFKKFLDNFYNVDVLARHRVSDQAWQNSFNVAVAASRDRDAACVDTWLTDFRDDLPKIDVPALVVQGIEDRILPIDATAARLPGADRGPHAGRDRGRPAQHRLDPPGGGELARCSTSSRTTSRPRSAWRRRSSRRSRRVGSLPYLPRGSGAAEKSPPG